MVDQTAGCDTYTAGRACTNVLHVLAQGLGVAILRTCTENGNKFFWGGVYGWMDGVELKHRVAISQKLKALLAFNGDID